MYRNKIKSKNLITVWSKLQIYQLEIPVFIYKLLCQRSLWHSVSYFDLCSNWNSFFTFWAPEKHVFHIATFRTTSYVLKRFGCLEISNRVSKWNKGKNLIFLWSILKICQLEIPVFIWKLNCQNSLWITVSYEFFEFICLANWNKCKTII